MSFNEAPGIAEYYICFSESDLDHWFIKLLDKYFRHCYAIKESDCKNFWIKIDPKRGFCNVQLFSKLQYPHIRKLTENDIVVKVRSVVDQERKHRFCIMNCVEVIKIILGLDKPFIFTPRQLYNFFIREGKNERCN